MTHRLLLIVLSLALTGGTKPQDTATPARLGGAQRYLTLLETDKPIYKIGETVFVRGTVLEAHTHVPTPSSWVELEIKGPKGDSLTSGRSAVAEGTFGFSWVVPEGTAGGEFTVLSKFSMGSQAKRSFDVRVYRAPRLKTQIVFARDGYGPGDEVTATLEVTRAEGGAPKGAKVTAVARVDGAEAGRTTTTVDGTGHATARFTLPRLIERGEGSLAFTIEDGGVVETAAKTIPILMQTVDIAFFPEGGDLVAGLPGRVYVEARTPADKPADLEGVVLDASGLEVATLRTEHEGRGRFALTPKSGGKYRLKLTSPAGISRTFPLPEVKADGAVLTAADEVTRPGAPVKLKVAWLGDRVVRVTLHQREKELDAVTVDAGQQQGAAVTLKPGTADGVLIATVTTKEGLPLAERLIYRQSEKNLKVELLPETPRTTPGAPVKLKLRTTVDGKPVSAVVGLTVTDDSVLEMIEKREQAPALPAMALLEGEVRELRDAHVYLNPADPKAASAIDLLLGTQGWRRFALLDVGTFLSRYNESASRVLAFVVPPPPPVMALGGVKGGGGCPQCGAAPGMAMGVPEAQVALAPRPLEKRPAAKPAEAPPRPANLQPAPKAAGDEQLGRLMARVARDEPMELPRGNLAEAGVKDRKKEWAAQQMAFVVIREFVHTVRPGRKANDRLDFAETLYWSAGVKTDAKTGEATVGFGTSDSVTSFRVRAGAFTPTGILGAADAKLDSVQPFYLEPRLPLEVTTGDLVRLPIAMVNGTTHGLKGAQLALAVKGDVRFTAPAAFDLKADERVRRVVELTIGAGTRAANLTLTGKAGEFQDVVTRELNVKPKGFPFEKGFGGLLAKNGRATLKLDLPADTVAGSVRAELAIYPSPMGNLTQAVSRLIQEPGGCFEQTSSTTYPMTMAMQYLTTHSGVDPKLVADASEKLDRGYKRLTGFECKQKGYEWFGEDPGHEALTAYGLLQFNDMKKVRSVDAGMLANTRAWLMKQRDGKGGFERKRRALHTWIEDRDSSDAYITWSLVEAGEKGLEKEIAHVTSAGLESKNSYVTALAANVAWLGGDKSSAHKMMAKLAGLQDKRGIVTGATQSIVGSMGESLEIETTSLAALAWLRSPEYQANSARAMQALAESCKGGRYGSTQSTVLALRAILEQERQSKADRAPGAVQVYVDGKKAGSPAQYDAKTEGAVMLSDVSELLGPGSHTIELALEGGGRLPYSARIVSYRVKPESAPETKVALDVKLSKSQLTEGDVVEATARVRNVTDALVPTVVAIVGLPGGLEPRHDQLKELVKQQTIDAYEVMGRDVVLYWRGMTPKQEIRVPLSLIAQVPGRYVGPASRAYLYYGDEHKAWVEGLTADIAAKN